MKRTCTGCWLIFLFHAAAGQSSAPFSPANERQQYFNTVQERTFRYFWDFAHPVSGLIPERTATPDIATSGGTGFGVMAIVAGVHRGWITRAEGLARLLKMTAFLEGAERFHGAWPHWIDARSGKAVPFSLYDNGGDLVETAYLVNGLLVARAYFDGKGKPERELRARITRLWEGVEWSGYVHKGLLHWHWSPDYEWRMNHPIGGYNECLITYVLALASPTHPITPEVYRATWKEHEPAHYRNGKEFLGYRLPLGFDWGGPLFFAHYSYLSLDPRLMEDEDANYWQLNVHQTLINRAYCLREAPREYGYSAQNWGLTAGDNHQFYGAHQPMREDNGTITPSAALSSFPYTPWYAMQALMYFYRIEGNRLFGDYGFYDGYNRSVGWYSNQYLAIDQGPIVVMLENYRSGLFWKLGQGIAELQTGLARMGIRRPDYPTGFYQYVPEAECQCTELMRQPDENRYALDFWVKGDAPLDITLAPEAGRAQSLAKSQAFAPGPHRFWFDASPGDYVLSIQQGGQQATARVRLH